MSSQSQLLKRYFTTGLIFLLPVAATIWVISWLINLINRVFLRHLFEMAWIQTIFGPLPTWIQPFLVGLTGLFIVVVAITGLGMFAGNVAGGWFIGRIDWFFKKVPITNKIYSFVQSLIENLNYTKLGSFERVVLIEYPRKGILSIGFVSRDLQGTLQNTLKGTRIAVFVPTSPNPTSGFIVITDMAEVIQLDIQPEDALKFVVSGGVLMPGVTASESSSGQVQAEE